MNSAPTGLSRGEMGFSLSDQSKYDILNLYKVLASHQKKLIEEKIKLNGFVRTKSAYEALNDLYFFVDEVSVKNKVYYHRPELDAFDRFTFSYFENQLSNIMRAKKEGRDLIVVGGGGFSLFHFRRWKLLCRFFMEVSGILKFERKKESSAENAFAEGL